jgi:hypothetical protein
MVSSSSSASPAAHSWLGVSFATSSSTTSTGSTTGSASTRTASNNNTQSPIALCLGTGRFLRSVLVPSLVGAGFEVALIQTRGRSFLEYMLLRINRNRSEDLNTTYNTYEVDTVLTSGAIETTEIPCHGAFSLGLPEDKHALVEVLPQFKGYGSSYLWMNLWMQCLVSFRLIHRNEGRSI